MHSFAIYLESPHNDTAACHRVVFFLNIEKAPG